MPGEPAVQKSTVALGNNETAPLVEASVSTPDVTYQLAMVKYPSRVAETTTVDVILIHFRNSMTAGHTFRNERPVNMGRVQGRELLLILSPSRSSAMRLYWSRSTLYRLTVAGSSGIETRPETRKFLESFEAISS